MVYSVVIAILVSYLLGNLNGAVCISALMHDDVRTHGSGNAGLTNFIRNYGAGRALYVILIDAGKAYLACLCSGLLLEPYGFGMEGVMVGGMAVMLGHDFPALLGFKGGKGVASSLGAAVLLNPHWGLMAGVIGIAVAAITRTISPASITGFTVYLIIALIFGSSLWDKIAAILLFAIVIYRHRDNIVRLLQGKETAVFARSDKKNK